MKTEEEMIRSDKVLRRNTARAIATGHRADYDLMLTDMLFQILMKIKTALITEAETSEKLQKIKEAIDEYHSIYRSAISNISHLLSK